MPHISSIESIFTGSGTLILRRKNPPGDIYCLNGYKSVLFDIMMAFRFFTKERDAFNGNDAKRVHPSGEFLPKWHKVQMKFHVKSYIKLGGKKWVNNLGT